jgi:hypothetical protein
MVNKLHGCAGVHREVIDRETLEASDRRSKEDIAMNPKALFNIAGVVRSMVIGAAVA